MKTRSSMSIKYTISTLHPTVPGSCIILNLLLPNGDKKNIIIDCGLFQEAVLNQFNTSLPFNPKNIDYVFLTHNHIDHSGRLPLLIKEGYDNNIFCSQITKDIIAPALFDCAGILEKESLLQSKKKGKNISQLFNKVDVINTLKCLRGMEYNKTYKINDNLCFTFLGNDHMMGAACILLQISYNKCEDVNLLFTGDYNCKNSFQNIPSLPKWVKNLKVIVIQESTYGDSVSSDIIYSYDDTIVDLLSNGRTVLSPVIACERAEQVLLRIKTLQDNNRISNSIPIFLAGTLAAEYFQIYSKKSIIDFIPQNLSIVSSKKINLHSPMLEGKNLQIIPEISDEILNNSNPKIILTTSGMADKGKAPLYLSKLAMRKDVTVFFTCYLPNGTLGYKLNSLKKGTEYTFNIFGEKVTIPINCDIISSNEFSSHAKGDQLINFLKIFPNLRGVFVNHGNPEKKEIYAQKVTDEVNPPFVNILDRSIFYTLSGNEIKKTNNSKFSLALPFEESQKRFGKDNQVKKNKPKYKRNRNKANKISKLFSY